jgi:uncharacterized protein (TIGR02145 family)
MFGKKCATCDKKVGGIFQGKNFGNPYRVLCERCAEREQRYREQHEREKQVKEQREREQRYREQHEREHREREQRQRERYERDQRDEALFALNRRDPLTDIDGNVYLTIKIGNQVWMAENLRTTKFNDGTSIPLVGGIVEYDGLTSYSNCNTPAYGWYYNDINNKNHYGALYNWHTVNTGKLSPKGWHIPSDTEWTELEEYLIDIGYNSDGMREGNKIAKSLAAKIDWISDSNLFAIGNDLTKNNRSGFSALPVGWLDEDGFLYGQGLRAAWWSTTKGGQSHQAFYRDLHNSWDNLSRSYTSRSCGFSVRCLKD